MRNATHYGTGAFAVLLLLVASASTLPSRVEATSQEPAPRKCCFTTPRHTGVCEVAPAKDETCRQILDYLNNPMSQGKAYCANTTVRGDWRSVACPSTK